MNSSNPTALKVHSCLGYGFQEVIYQRALAHEMYKRGLQFKRELEMSIHVLTFSTTFTHSFNRQFLISTRSTVTAVPRKCE